MIKLGFCPVFLMEACDITLDMPAIYSALTLTMLWANSADNKLKMFFFFFFLESRI